MVSFFPLLRRNARCDCRYNPLLDPVLELFNGNGTAINFNYDWKANHTAIEAIGCQPSNDAESALASFEVYIFE